MQFCACRQWNFHNLMSVDRIIRSAPFAATFSCDSLLLMRIAVLICCHFAAVLTVELAPTSGHSLSQDALASLNRDASTVLSALLPSYQQLTSLQVLSLDFYRELWSRRIDGIKAPPASSFAASTRPACTYKHRSIYCAYLCVPMVRKVH